MTRGARTLKDESRARQECKYTLAPVLPTLAFHRVQLNAMDKARVTDVNKCVNPYAVIT